MIEGNGLKGIGALISFNPSVSPSIAPQLFDAFA